MPPHRTEFVTPRVRRAPADKRAAPTRLPTDKMQFIK